MKVLILTADSNGGYPVPAVKGGAVSTLIEHLVKGNNEEQLCDMTIVSFYDSKAEIIAREKYPHIHFVWVKVPAFIKILDSALFWTIRSFFKNKKPISYKSAFSLLWYIHKASQYLSQNTFDKVILENNIPIARIIKNSSYQGEYYYHLHNVPRINAGCPEIFDRCTAFLCVSKYVGREIAKETNAIGPVPKEKIRVLYNAIDTKLFHPFTIEKKKEVTEKIRRKYHIPASNKIIIFTGRLSAEKGADKVLQAAEQIEKVTVLIVGGLLSGLNLTDPYQKKIHKLAREMGSKVVFTGYIDQKELPQYYNAADIAVLPSMWDEPAGLTMIEAMACGVPVITTKSGGIPEYTGNSIQLERDKNLIEEIKMTTIQILNNLSYQEQLKKLGIDYVRKRFDSENYIDRFIEVLKN